MTNLQIINEIRFMLDKIQEDVITVENYGYRTRLTDIKRRKKLIAEKLEIVVNNLKREVTNSR